MKTLYKVLNPDMKSPYRDYPYKLGKKYHCPDFDTNSRNPCGRGFYATSIDGLIYAFNASKSRVFQCKVWGKEVEFNQYKRRYEWIELEKEFSHEEIKEKAKEIEHEAGYKISEALFPVNPLLIKAKPVTQDEIDKLHKWASIDEIDWNLNSVLIGRSVGDLVKENLWRAHYMTIGENLAGIIWRATTGGKIFHSLRKARWAYISSFFNEANDPCQPCIDLWKSGFVPSFDGQVWRLHAGKKGKIVFEMGD